MASSGCSRSSSSSAAVATLFRVGRNMARSGAVAVLGMNRSEEFVFHGYARIAAYRGAFGVLGHELRPRADRGGRLTLLPMICPTTNALPPVQCLRTRAEQYHLEEESESESELELECITSTDEEIKGDVEKAVAMLPNKGEGFDGILVVADYSGLGLSDLQRLGQDYNVFAPKQTQRARATVGDQNDATFTVPNVHVHVHTHTHAQYDNEGAAEPSPQQLRVVRFDPPENVEAALAELAKPGAHELFHVMLAPSGRGKSTWTRILTNALLQRASRRGVLLLDLDPGPSEVAFCGAMALALVRRPLLGPAYMAGLASKAHLEMLHTRYFGGNTPQNNPSAYVETARELLALASAEARARRVPVVVNTMGWVHNLGMELSIEILRSCDPQRTVLVVPDGRQNLPPALVRHAEQRLNIPIRDVPGAPLCANGASVPSRVLRNIGLAVALMARRDHGPEKRFCFDATPPCSQAFPLYAIPASKINLWTPYQGALAVRDALRAITGTVVALTESPPSPPPPPSTASSPPPHAKWHGLHVHGLGIVRGAEPDGTLYLATRVPHEQLAKVTMLVRGMIELPRELAFAGLPALVSGAVPPYTSLESGDDQREAGGGGAPRQRRALARPPG